MYRNLVLSLLSAAIWWAAIFSNSSKAQCVTTSIDQLSSSYCVGHSSIELAGTPAGGTFSGNGVSGGLFNPGVAGVGTHIITYVSPSTSNYVSSRSTGLSLLNSVGTDVKSTKSTDNLNSPGWDNVLWGAFPIGFTFNFYGTDYTQFYISSNGFITFGDGGNSGIGPQTLPTGEWGPGLIAFAWSDLVIEPSSEVSYFTTGIAPNRKLVINFNNARFAGAVTTPAERISVQIQLTEGINKIALQNTRNVAETGGRNMTIGVQKNGTSFNIFDRVYVSPTGFNNADKSTYGSINEVIEFTRCPSQTVTQSVTVTDDKLAPPTITSAFNTLCAGDSTVLTATGCSEYFGWYDGTSDYNTLSSKRTVLAPDQNGANKTYEVYCFTADRCYSNSSHYTIYAANPKPVNVWDKAYGGTNTDAFNDIYPRAHGGFLMGGSSSVNASGDLATILTGENGNVVQVAGWDLSSKNEELSSIVSTNNGGFWLAGNISSLGGSARDYLLQRIDSTNSKLVFRSTFGGSGTDILRSPCSTKDGGILLGGNSSSLKNGDKTQDPIAAGATNYWIVRIDPTGKKVWDKVYGGNASDYLYKVIPVSDGGYLLAGETTSTVSGLTAKGGTDFYIIKIDGDGNKLWESRYGGSGSDYCRAAVETADGGFLVGGFTNSPVGYDVSKSPKGGLSDWWILKIDANGNFTPGTDRRYGGTNYEELHDIQAISGGFLIGGISSSNASDDKSEPSRGGLDYWVMKVDDAGNRIWDKTYGGSKDDYLTCMQVTTDGGFILGGTSTSPADGDKTVSNVENGNWWAIKSWIPVAPVVRASQMVLCNGLSTMLSAGNCPGIVTWSTGAVGATLVVSPAVSTDYTANCTVSGQSSCPSKPIHIVVCQPGNQSTYGYTQGNFSATDGGAATYSIPIVLPAGSAGMKPELSLSYSSQGGNGLVGVGWSLDGLHAISRSTKTRAQDEAFDVTRNSAIGISFSKEDRYSLDGSRLVLAPSSLIHSGYRSTQC